MKVAIVHEYLNQYGGAERVLEVLHEIFPEAPIYTLIHEPDSMPDFYRSWDIRQSPYLKSRFIRRYYKSFFFLYPIFMELFDLRGYDLVISSSYAYAHGILTPPGTCHICYCYTPMRFVWVHPENYRAYIPKYFRLIYDFLIHALRLWDQSASQRPDYYVAISQNVAKRIARYYHRPATVIYPPMDVSRFQLFDKQGDYYLLVSRLVSPHKAIELVIESFNRLQLPLKIVGDGTDRKHLEKMANPNIQFLGYLSESELVTAYRQCKALIFPGEDDFGLVPLEANACRKPVIAYRAGGVLESQVENITAIYFDQPTPDSLIKAIHEFGTHTFNPAVIRDNVQRFEKEIFKKKMKEFIDYAIQSHQTQYKFPVIHT